MAREKERGTEKDTDRRRIEVRKDGPYTVLGTIPLLELTVYNDADDYPYGYHVTKQYPLKEAYSLCRCGQSKDKPFCDGTHTRVHFDGSETATQASYLSRAEELDGPSLVLRDVRDLCAHVGMCDRAGGTQKLTLHSDDPQARHIAIEEAANCNSGRLVVVNKETGKPIEPELDPSIAAVEEPLRGYSGTLWIRGGIPVVAADGTTYEVRNRVALCRCGRSSNRPFCDGSHRETKEDVSR